MSQKSRARRAVPFVSLLSLWAAPEAAAQDGCFDDIPGLPSLNGTAGNDFLVTSNNAEGVCGLEGNDTINSAGGDDYIDGGPDRDSLLGGLGNDYIAAGPGDDRLFGDRGDDELLGESGRDSLFGGMGQDVLRAGPDDDFLRGESGNDDLWGDEGFDILEGGAHDDTYNYRYGDESDIIHDTSGANVLRLHVIPSSQVSTLVLPGGDLAVIIDGAGVIVIEEGTGGGSMPIEYCQKTFDVPGSTMELEVCGDDLTLPGAVAGVRLEQAPPSSIAFLVVGSTLSPVPIPGTDTFLAPGGTLVVAAFPTSANGTLDFSTPSSASAWGVAVYAQMLAKEGPDIVTSNAVELQL